MIEMIRNYEPKTKQETKEKAVMLDFITKNPDVLTRENGVAHLTSSAIVVNASLDRVLFAHHNLYGSWAWVGGHNDGDADLLEVAIKEAREETGVERIEPYDGEIFMLDIIHVTNHMKNGDYVPDHLHLNVTFLLVADETESTKVKPDENSGVRWFYIDEVLDHVREERMKPIYEKAFATIRALRMKRSRDK